MNDCEMVSNMKLVRELVYKTFDLGVLTASLAMADSSHNEEWVKSGRKIRDEAGSEIEELAKKIVSRMKVVDDDV